VNAFVVGFCMSYVTGMSTLIWMLNVGTKGNNSLLRAGRASVAFLAPNAVLGK
jgi:hypothetical protein